MKRVRGLDISEAQGHIDFDKLPAWVAYVIVKCSEGATYKDPARIRNMAEARRRQLRVFVYAFLRTSQDVAAQAANLLDAVGETSPTLAFIDFETIATGMSPTAAVAELVTMAKAVIAAFGRGGVYSFPYFCEGAMGKALAASAELAELVASGLLFFWSADYRGGEDPPETFKPFVSKPWTWAPFVQTSGDKSSFVTGVTGHVDHDYFDGDEAAFATFLGEPTAAQSEPDAPTVRELPDCGETPDDVA